MTTQTMCELCEEHAATHRIQNHVGVFCAECAGEFDSRDSACASATQDILIRVIGALHHLYLRENADLTRRAVDEAVEVVLAGDLLQGDVAHTCLDRMPSVEAEPLLEVAA